MTELERTIEAIVERVLARKQGFAASTEFYTSLSLPPDCATRGRFRELAPGFKSAKKQGRVWMVDKAEWDAARSATRRPVAATKSMEEIADEVLIKAGYRATK